MDKSTKESENENYNSSYFGHKTKLKPLLIGHESSERLMRELNMNTREKIKKYRDWLINDERVNKQQKQRLLMED